MRSIRTLVLCALAILSFNACACASEEVAEQIFGRSSVEASSKLGEKTFNVGDFNSVSCSISADVYYTQGRPSIKVVVPENFIEEDLVVVDLRGDEVTIKYRARVSGGRKGAKVYISCPELNKLTLNGSCDFTANEAITAKEAEYIINGSGSIVIDGIKANELMTKINGSGTVKIQGLDCGEISSSINGSGNMELSGRSAAAQLKINGSGNINVKNLSCSELDTKINGSGRVISSSK